MIIWWDALLPQTELKWSKKNLEMKNRMKDMKLNLEKSPKKNQELNDHFSSKRKRFPQQRVDLKVELHQVHLKQEKHQKNLQHLKLNGITYLTLWLSQIFVLVNEEPGKFYDHWTDISKVDNWQRWWVHQELVNQHYWVAYVAIEQQVWLVILRLMGSIKSRFQLLIKMITCSIDWLSEKQWCLHRKWKTQAKLDWNTKLLSRTSLTFWKLNHALTHHWVVAVVDNENEYQLHLSWYQNQIFWCSMNPQVVWTVSLRITLLRCCKNWPNRKNRWQS